MKKLLTLILICLSLSGFAAEIETYDGKKYSDAKVIAIKDGFLYFVQGDDKIKRALAEVKSITDYAPQCSLTKFEEYEGKYSGKKLGVNVEVNKGRIPEPLIRAYSMEEDDKGSRELVLYQNFRAKDPSRLESVSEVATRSYRNREFILEKSKGVAYRIEIWLQGELAFSKEIATKAVPANWWRQGRIRKTLTLREVPVKVVRKEKREEKREEEEEDKLKQISTDMSMMTQAIAAGKDLEVSVRYSISSTSLKGFRKPQIKLYYVTEAERQQDRRIASATLQAEGSRDVLFTNNRHNDEVKHVLKNTVAGGVVLDQGLRRFLYWRLELSYGDKIITVKEAPNQRLKATLPKDWWKD